MEEGVRFLEGVLGVPWVLQTDRDFVKLLVGNSLSHQQHINCNC